MLMGFLSISELLIIIFLCKTFQFVDTYYSLALFSSLILGDQQGKNRELGNVIFNALPNLWRDPIPSSQLLQSVPLAHALLKTLDTLSSLPAIF